MVPAAGAVSQATLLVKPFVRQVDDVLALAETLKAPRVSNTIRVTVCDVINPKCTDWTVRCTEGLCALLASTSLKAYPISLDGRA